MSGFSHFVEGQHPRGRGGKFAKKGSSSKYKAKNKSPHPGQPKKGKTKGYVVKHYDGKLSIHKDRKSADAAVRSSRRENRHLVLGGAAGAVAGAAATGGHPLGAAAGYVAGASAGRAHARKTAKAAAARSAARAAARAKRKKARTKASRR